MHEAVQKVRALTPLFRLAARHVRIDDDHSRELAVFPRHQLVFPTGAVQTRGLAPPRSRAFLSLREPDEDEVCEANRDIEPGRVVVVDDFSSREIVVRTVVAHDAVGQLLEEGASLGVEDADAPVEFLHENVHSVLLDGHEAAAAALDAVRGRGLGAVARQRGRVKVAGRTHSWRGHGARFTQTEIRDAKLASLLAS